MDGYEFMLPYRIGVEERGGQTEERTTGKESERIKDHDMPM